MDGRYPENAGYGWMAGILRMQGMALHLYSQLGMVVVQFWAAASHPWALP